MVRPMMQLLPLFAALATSLLFATSSFAQSAGVPAVTVTPATVASAASAQWHARNAFYFKRKWGVDIVDVRPLSSGYMLAFRYRVLDPDKAKLLNDRKAKAYLRDEASGAVFAVPAMENIGELRSGTAPEADRIYYMIFGNPGRFVKAGSRVSIVAGDFHADGLVVGF